MIYRLVIVLCLFTIGPAVPGALGQTSVPDSTLPITALKVALAELRSDYLEKIAALQERIDVIEAQRELRQVGVSSNEPLAIAPRAQLAANNFNPAIGMVLAGTVGTFDRVAMAVPGFLQGRDLDTGAQGFALGESELNIRANIDDKFYGNFTLALGSDDGRTDTSLEEAWIQTLGLPAGVALKAGRFFSAVGHRNEFHRHADNFVDRSLVYQLFMSGQYIDDGIQLRWLAPTERYLELGAEWLAGNGFARADGTRGGRDTWVAFGRTGGDVGRGSSWQAGLSWLNASAHGFEEIAAGGSGNFTGEVNQGLLDLVWKWAPNGNPQRQHLQVEGAVLWQHHDGQFAPSTITEPGLVANTDNGNRNQWGYSLEAVYQFRPRWRAGLRYSRVRSNALQDLLVGSTFDTLGEQPSAFTAMLDWSNSEFSRLRLQYSHEELAPQGANKWFLQYLMSVGAHGAHQF